ncbi:hypothetical protein BLA27_18520 [Brucella cytisi]|uniref:Uncharacterized protein n=1 Tax=Brucella cytisi TaxID=407152 RepID=A0A1J6HI78_9HYPH|nr:hypothetical protein BLA27_18520 [Brucella cytisi]
MNGRYEGWKLPGRIASSFQPFETKSEKLESRPSRMAARALEVIKPALNEGAFARSERITFNCVLRTGGPMNSDVRQNYFTLKAEIKSAIGLTPSTGEPLVLDARTR